MTSDAELLAALELAAQFIAQTIATNRMLVATLRGGRGHTEAELQAMEERVGTDVAT